VTDVNELNGFDFVSHRNLRIRVRGTAILLVPAGFRFDNGLTVAPFLEATTANLVLVVGPNGRYSGWDHGVWTYQGDVGPWFANGFEIAGGDSAKVFVVTHGSMKDKEDGGASDHNVATSVCIFAHDFTMYPGFITGNHMERRYGASMRAVADDLLQRGLLPPGIGAPSNSFALSPGTWRESPGLQ
jgi:hypothetical protein